MIILRQKEFGLIGKLTYKLQNKLDDKNENLIKSIEDVRSKKK